MQRLILSLIKLLRENKLLQELRVTCKFALMQITNKIIYHACPYILCPRILICSVYTYLQRMLKIILKSPGLSIVSGPRNVLRDKQGRSIM